MDDALRFPPISAVLLDLHSTLVDQGTARQWLELGWRRAGRDGAPADGLGADGEQRLLAVLDQVWERARELDPANERDLSAARHRSVFGEVLDAHAPVDPPLRDALYDALLDPWVAYDDSAPLLRELSRRGIPAVVLSNVGIDVRPVLERSGLAEHLTGVVLSFEVGSAKPAAEIFLRALEVAGVPAERALMVGDSSADDAAAARVGIRTLVLPRTRGPVHGLGAVLRLVEPEASALSP